MIKRNLIRAAVVVAALTMAGPAQAEDGPAFNVHFYSDETHETQVGFARAACSPGPHAQMYWGYSTQFQEVVFIGQCVGGVLYYD